MSSSIIGRVKTGSGKSVEVKWNQTSKEIYIGYAGWTFVGHANSASEAMRKAEAWLYNK